MYRRESHVGIPSYHERRERVDDLAALLSSATVYQFMARPVRDLDGIRLLATALMLSWWTKRIGCAGGCKAHHTPASALT